MTASMLDAGQIDESRITKLLWRVLLVGLGMRLVLATILPLSFDEAYATAVAREFSWAFFDHPPLGFWVPVLAANLTGVEHTLIYRAPTLIFGTWAAYAMYLLGRELGGARAGLISAVLFSIAPFFLLTGILIYPDGPLAVAVLYCVLWLVRIVKCKDAVPLRYWVWGGVALAFGLASKYHAGLIPVAALIFAIFSPNGRRWFATPGPYVASAIGLVGLAPVLIWNLQNDWASFAFHLSRTGDGLQPGNLVLMLVEQVILLLPPLFVLATICVFCAFKNGPSERVLVALVALLPVLCFNVIYVMSIKSLPHWTMPGWLMALPLVGLMLAQVPAHVLRRVRNWTLVLGTPIYLLLLGSVLQLGTGALSRVVPGKFIPFENSLSAFDYSPLYDELEQINALEGVDVIAATSWLQAGFMSTALHGDFPVKVLNDTKHHFAFMRGETQTGAGLLLQSSLLRDDALALRKLRRFALSFDPEAEALTPIVLSRGGVPFVVVNAFRLTFPPE